MFHHQRNPFSAGIVVLVVVVLGRFAAAATNYDEDKVGAYTLPDPLLLSNGQKVTDAETWNTQRRPELIKLFEDNQFGRCPPARPDTTFEVLETDPLAMNGDAIRRQVVVYFTGMTGGPRMHMLIYLPKSAAKKPVPLFLCLSFAALFQVTDDPAVQLSTIWDTKKKATSQPAEGLRGKSAKEWPIKTILSRGYGIAIIYYCEIEPDFSGGLPLGVRSIYVKPGQTDVGPDEWGAIAAWGWGASRGLDYLETDKEVDAQHVALMGHSRLGKTVMWAGARDTRFAMVVASCSGEGGAALSRRDYGETVKDLTTRFPYQFCANYQKYADHVEQLPMDAHELVSLIAPRPLFLSTGVLDRWSDPKGEFLSAVAASPVYKLLGRKGIGATDFPSLDQPLMNDLGFNCHQGKHEVLNSDWNKFLDFADQHMRPSAAP